MMTLITLGLMTATLVLFVRVMVSVLLSVVRQTAGTSGPTPGSAPADSTLGAGASTHPASYVERWTPLDDVQLARLLANRCEPD